jgi:hypothetical protein
MCGLAQHLVDEALSNCFFVTFLFNFMSLVNFLLIFSTILLSFNLIIIFSFYLFSNALWTILYSNAHT